MNFPFARYRKGQRELAVAVYKTIAGGKKLYVKAPTGIGKTISTLFPSVKIMGEGHISKIFYLTAKTITRSVAQEALSIMREKGLLIKSVTLTAKEKICFLEKANCKPEKCEYAKGHYDRINDAIMDVLAQECEINREVIEEYAKRHRVCPFELSLDLTLWADVIICDYNYAFDPRVYLKRFFSDNGGDYAFLIDEAHNLVDRAREMFSAQMSKKSFLEMKKAMKDKSSKSPSSKQAQYLYAKMKKLMKVRLFCRQRGAKGLISAFGKVYHECDKYLATDAKHGEEMKSFCSFILMLWPL